MLQMKNDLICFKRIIMRSTNIGILCALYIALVIGSVNSLNSRYFPDDFMLGVATASYQVEGGWNADGKGENVWDYITHNNPSFVLNEDNGDVSCDQYHKWKEDVQLLKHLGVNHYRFSLSWSRILPTGLSNEVNAAGVSYYKNLIAELRANNIEPVVTLHHWDYPQPLQDVGGWTSKYMIDYFASYARVVFRELGDNVTYWSTFNEPQQTCHDGFGMGSLAPGIKLPGVAEYVCAYHIMLAHAKAYHIYDEEFRATQNGSVSIVVNSEWSEPATDSAEDVAAAERRLQFSFGLYANPIFNGDWPEIVKERVALRSAGENFTSSRLPQFTKEEIDYINGTYDFFGFNSYRSRLVEDIDEPEFGEPSNDYDIKCNAYFDPTWNTTRTGAVIVPWGERKLLQWVKKTFNNPKILITENGAFDDGTSLKDEDRITYLSTYLSAVLDAIYEDEVKVIGYTAWSLMDNFEWAKGYTMHYGLYHVNFTDANRTRTPKTSVEFYRNVTSKRCLVDELNCTSSVGGLSLSPFIISLPFIVFMKFMF